MIHHEPTAQIRQDLAGRLVVVDPTAVADPSNYTYFLELVNCNLALEPIGVQITLSMP